MNLKTNPELLPLVEWWEKDGKSTVIWLLVAAIAVGGWHYWKTSCAAKKAAASEAVVSVYTAEEIEDAIVKFAGSASEGALKLRLAKSYYDAGRYDEALAQYEAMENAAPKGFEDVPVVGKAHCLEALGKFDEAAALFDNFADQNPKSFLALTAQLGSVRCFAQQGDQKKALARIDALKAANKDDELSLARIEATEKLVKRYQAK